MNEPLWIPVSKIQPNPWNPNVMPSREYAILKEDMHAVGPRGTGLIILSPAKVFYGQPLSDLGQYYVIVDGEHRWRIAQELGWEEIRAEIREVSEEEAKAICYRANREHGNLDPFKEAALFKTDLDNKLTQEQIAAKYLIDATTVSHRLSLLKLSSDVVEAAKKEMPRGNITVSHLEPLTTLPPQDQKLMLKEIKTRDVTWRNPPSVRDVEQSVERLKRQREMERKLQSAVSKAKHKKCPKCGKRPVNIYHKGLPWVECESRNYDHTWNLDTGKLLWATTSTGARRDTAQRIQPQTLRSNHTVQEIHKVFAEQIKRLYPQIDVSKVRVEGKLNNQKISIDLTTYERIVSVSVQYGPGHYPKDYRGFRAEEHKYKTGEVTTVHCGSPQLIEQTKQFIEQAFKGNLIPEEKEKRS